MSQMGSLEAVVSMLGAALEYAKGTGDWTWFQRLLHFILWTTWWSWPPPRSAP